VALECASRGAKLVLGCRNTIKAEALCAHIKRKTGNDDIYYVIVDLASLASVRQLVEVLCRQRWIVDILINNAGPHAQSYFVLLSPLPRSGCSFVSVPRFQTPSGLGDVGRGRTWQVDTAPGCVSTMQSTPPVHHM